MVGDAVEVIRGGNSSPRSPDQGERSDIPPPRLRDQGERSDVPSPRLRDQGERDIPSPRLRGEGQGEGRHATTPPSTPGTVIHLPPPPLYQRLWRFLFSDARLFQIVFQ